MPDENDTSHLDEFADRHRDRTPEEIDAAMAALAATEPGMMRLVDLTRPMPRERERTLAEIEAEIGGRMNETDAAVHAWKGPGEYRILTLADYETLQSFYDDRSPGWAPIGALPLYVGVPVPVVERYRPVIYRTGGPSHGVTGNGATLTEALDWIARNRDPGDIAKLYNAMTGEVMTVD